MTMKPELIVVGSHAPGKSVNVHRVPVAGETVIGWNFQEPIDGGKGSNQAIAAARLGTKTSFVGCVGDDRMGQEAKEWMDSVGIDLTYLYKSNKQRTGVGFIILDDNGIPAMVTTLGANEELNKDLVINAIEHQSEAKVLLTQFEIPPEIALFAARTAQNFNMLSIINPAPFVDIDLAELNGIDILVPNESEAKSLLGYQQNDIVVTLELAKALRKMSGAHIVIITLGEQGIVATSDSKDWEVKPIKVKAIDTSGAGDVFCASLAAGIIKGWDIQKASEWACLASALSVTKAGSIPSFPTTMEVENFQINNVH